MTPSCDSTVEAIGKGGIGCREADGFDIAGEADRAEEADECNVALGALFTVARVGDDLRHPADHSVVAVGVQLVGPQLYLILVLVVFSAGREAEGRAERPLLSRPLLPYATLAQIPYGTEGLVLPMTLTPHFYL